MVNNEQCIYGEKYIICIQAGTKNEEALLDEIYNKENQVEQIISMDLWSCPFFYKR